MEEPAIQELAAQLRGTLLRPGDAGYEQACKVYNGMIDKHPALIAHCVDVADVIAAVNFAREHKLTLAVRGGGHSGPGLGTCDDGLVIDLSGMKGIRVDPTARTVRVEGGCTWGEVDHATHAFGLATPSGFISTTGVGGLTLGGGIGYLSRTLGLTIDNLLGVDMVLADGSFVTASAEEHADLFWAVRGGGGNFGVVTSFLYQLHPISTVYGGPMFWPLEQGGRADDVLARLHPERARGDQRLVRVRDRAARATLPGAVSPPEDVRDRLVLHRRDGAGGRGVQADTRLRAASD